MSALMPPQAQTPRAIFWQNRINDDTHQPPDYRNSPPQTRAWLDQLRFSDVTWTRSSVLGTAGQDGSVTGTGGIIQADCQRWEWNFPNTGGHYRKVVSGVVRDSSNNPVSGAVVQLFNTATGLLVDTSIATDAGGTYKVGDPNNVTCFAVGYKTGSPDTEGGTVNTVTGT